MAQLPVPGRSVGNPGLTDRAAYRIDPLPAAPRAALTVLSEAGHEAVLVGGCIRDLLLGHGTQDWDLATSAAPDVVSGLFAGSHRENPFGTVTLPGSPLVEITSYRSEGGYRDRRRPETVSFGTSLAGDLQRRDFTINAIAWRPTDLKAGLGELIDPHAGIADIRDGVIRAVGAPAARFSEDSLRLLRAVRFSLRLGFRIDPATEDALRAGAPTAAALSGERVRDELLRLLADPSISPSRALHRWEELGLLAVLLPELAELRGVEGATGPPGDALDHALRTADALSPDDPILRLAGLLHAIGTGAAEAGQRPGRQGDGGAAPARDIMRRLRFSGEQAERVERLVRLQAFDYRQSWSDSAVRRFVARVGLERLDELFALRAADSIASGGDADERARLDELRERTEGQRGSPVTPDQLAVDGHDLQRELGIAPGPEVGRLLARLMDAVLEDPALNERAALLDLARAQEGDA